MLSKASGSAKISYRFCGLGQAHKKFGGWPHRQQNLAKGQSLAALSTEEGIASEECGELSPPKDLVEIGVFGPPHGVHGEIRLQAITDTLEDRLEQPGVRWAQRQKGRGPKPFTPIVIDEYRSTITKGRQTWLVKVEGVDSIEEAEQLRGQMLSMSAQERPQIDDEDEFYVQELIGMQVFLQKDDRRIGTVVDVFDGTGTHDLLRVKLDHSTDIVDLNLAPTAMIPFVKEIVPIVDRAERRLGIEPPEGLLNIPAMIKNAGTPKKKKGQKQIQFQPVQTDAAQNIPAS